MSGHGSWLGCNVRWQLCSWLALKIKTFCWWKFGKSARSFTKNLTTLSRWSFVARALVECAELYCKVRTRRICPNFAQMWLLDCCRTFWHITSNFSFSLLNVIDGKLDSIAVLIHLFIEETLARIYDPECEGKITVSDRITVVNVQKSIEWKTTQDNFGKFLIVKNTHTNVKSVRVEKWKMENMAFACMCAELGCKLRTRLFFNYCRSMQFIEVWQVKHRNFHKIKKFQKW